MLLLHTVYCLSKLSASAWRCRAYAWSWGPLGWLYPTEIQTLETRSCGLAVASCCNLLFSAVIAPTFLTMLCSLKVHPAPAHQAASRSTLLLHSSQPTPWLLRSSRLIAWSVPKPFLALRTGSGGWCCLTQRTMQCICGTDLTHHALRSLGVSSCPATHIKACTCSAHQKPAQQCCGTAGL